MEVKKKINKYDIDELFGKLNEKKQTKEQGQEKGQTQKKDIDELFGKLNEKNKPKEKPVTKEQDVKKKQKTSKQTKQQKVNNKLKFTEEGFKIYTEEDLKLGKGGNTNLCPFDCECCF